MNQFIPYNCKLKKNSQRLRSNQTNAEQLLWSRLRRKQLNGRQFYRQKPLGQFIVDFYAPSVNLVIEVERGLTVLRFNNLQVLQELDTVLEIIEPYTC